MPRAFLITNKRYNSSVDYEDNQLSRENSPERGVSTAEEPLCRTTPCDSETDSIGFETLKPTSPHSPAHESRSLQSSPSVDDTRSLGHTIYRPNDHITPPSTPFSTLSMSPSSSSCGAIFRPNHHNTASALVTVIRQLMQQQQSQPATAIIRASPDSSNCSSPSRNASPNGCNYASHAPPTQQTHASTTDNHICHECGKRYSTSSNLARHRQTHRSVTDKKARKCPHCDKVYVSMPAYSMHVRTHSQGCQCPYCGKCFSRPWLLQGHIRTHTGEKPFTCPVCRKAFADKSNLRAHIQTHSSSKPYVCQRCGKAFALKSYLYKHEESSCMRVHRQQQQGRDNPVPSTTILDLANKGGNSGSVQSPPPSILVERGSAAILVG